MTILRKRVHELVVQGVRTTDAARPMGDAVLTCPSAQQWASYNKSVAAGVDIGLVWDGGLKPILDAADPKSRKMLLDRIAVYGEMMQANDDDPDMATGELEDDGKKAVGNLDHDPLGRREAQAFNQRLNDQRREFWNRRLGR